MYVWKLFAFILIIFMFSKCVNQKNPTIIVFDSNKNFFKEVFLFKAGPPHSFESTKKDYLYLVHHGRCFYEKEVGGTLNEYDFLMALARTLNIKQCHWSRGLNKKFYEKSKDYFKKNLNNLFCFNISFKKFNLSAWKYKEYPVCRCINYLYFPKEIEELKRILDEIDDCKSEEFYNPEGGVEG